MGRLASALSEAVGQGTASSTDAQPCLRCSGDTAPAPVALQPHTPKDDEPGL